MTETAAQRELARQVARIDREAKRQVDIAGIRCPQHGVHFACPDAGSTPCYRPASQEVWGWGLRQGPLQPTAPCRHTACIAILHGYCPDCNERCPA